MASTAPATTAPATELAGRVRVSSEIPGLRRRGGLAAHRERTGQKGLEPALLGLMLFVASEVMFFGGFFGAYFHFRGQVDVWPPAPFEPLHVPYAAWQTVILVSSSVTIQLAIFAIRRNALILTQALVGVTVALGAFFLLTLANEWRGLEFTIKDGIWPSLFYTITGFHGLHVAGGVLALTFLLVKALRKEFSADHHVMVEAVSFYWHFVDVVWVFVFTVLYVLPEIQHHTPGLP